MSNTFHRSGFEESILYSDEDYEPYGYVSSQTRQVSNTSDYTRSRRYEREVEASVLCRLDNLVGW